MDDSHRVLEALLERWRSWQSPTWWKPIKEQVLQDVLGWPSKRIRVALEPHLAAGSVTRHSGLEDGKSTTLYALTGDGLRRAGKAYYDLYAAENPGLLEAMGRVD